MTSEELQKWPEKMQAEMLKKFWIWIVKEVQPDVIDFIDFIGCEGWNNGQMTPMYSIDELIEVYQMSDNIELSKDSPICPKCKRITLVDGECPGWAEEICKPIKESN